MLHLLTRHNITTFLLYLFVFVLPLQTRWIFVESSIPFQEMSLYGFDIILILLFVVIVSNSKSVLGSKKIRHSHPPKVLILIAYSLPLIALLSTLWSPHTNLTLYWALRLLLGVSMIVLLPRAVIEVRKLALVLVSALLLQALLGTAQFMTQDTLIVTKWLGTAEHEAHTLGTSVIETTTGRWLRAYGTQPHPNIFGGLMVLGIILTCYLIITQKLGRVYGWFIARRIALTTTLLLLTTGLLFSFSRSAWVALAIIAVMVTITSYRKSLRPINPAQYMLLPSLVLIFICTTLYAPVFHTRFQTHARLEQKSITERVHSLTDARTLIREHPLIGTGIGTYTTALQQHHPQRPDYAIHPIHNVYLLILAELGMLGMMLCIMLGGTLLYHALRHHRPLSTEHRTLYASSAALLILSLFDHYLWTLPSVFFIFWLLIALPAKKRS